MPTVQSIVCLFCQTANPGRADNCASCGQPLAPSRAARHLDRAEADITRGQYNQARANLTKADVEMLAVGAEQRRRLLLTARAFYLQALVYYHKGETDAAREEMLLARQSVEGEPNNQILLANILNGLGNIEYYREHLDSAVDYYRSSSEVASAAGAHAIAAKAIANLGNISTSQGNPDVSHALYDRALAEAELGGDPRQVADIYRLISYVYLKNGPVSKAIEYAEQAVALRDQIDDQAAICRVISDTGNVYLRCGDLDRAATYLNEAYALAQRIEYRLMQVVNLMYLAALARQRGDQPAWLNYASRAFNMTGSAVVWRNEAALLLVEYCVSEQRWGEARRYIEQMEENVRLHGFEGDIIHLDHARALLHAAQEEWAAAELYFAAALAALEANHDLLDTAELQEKYAAMLLRRAELERNPTVHARARAILEQAIANYRQLGLTERLTRLEALLNHQQSNLLNRLKNFKQPKTA